MTSGPLAAAFCLLVTGAYLPACLLCPVNHTPHLTGIGCCWVGVVLPVGASESVRERGLRE